jgi:chromate reductase, NAD(P)H dehydrogenase (quinone)
MRIVGVSGSLRASSMNSGLLRAAVTEMQAGATLELGLIQEFPLYNADIDVVRGTPAPVVELKNLIASADGLLLATPEYNHSIPGVLKNAIDWLSRPQQDIERVFAGRPVAIIGAAPGPFGTLQAQTAWLPVLRSLRAEVWSGSVLQIGRASSSFNVHGDLVDVIVRAELRTFLAGFCTFAASRR